MLMQEERELIVEIGKQMSTSGLCPGTSGNQSIYNPELGYMAIKPSGIGYMETKPEDIASLGGLKTVSVDAHSRTELAVTVLTRNPDHPKRELTVSWYLWGQANRRTLTVQ